MRPIDCGTVFYHDSVPAWMDTLAATGPMTRLQGVGMDCGMEYTSFPLFRSAAPYSRFRHSLGAGLIVWHFTGDKKQAAAALLHDIATPTFAHTVDFLKGDSLTQTATEQGTEALIAASPELGQALSEIGLCPEDVSDYHRYPIADNDSPRLSSDRLEYTLSNAERYGFARRETLTACYNDIIVAAAEDGQEELVFRSPARAGDFARAALACSRVYVSEADRYGMQRLAEVLAFALQKGIIYENDLRGTEAPLIEKLRADKDTAVLWARYRALHRMLGPEEPRPAEDMRIIPAKKRFIDPLIDGIGRLSAWDKAFAAELNAFLFQSQDIPLCGK